MDIKVLYEALKSTWYIEPGAAEFYSLIIHKLFAGEKITEFEETEMAEYAYIVDASGKKIGTIADAVDNGVAVINLRGAVMKYDYCGAPGTQTLMQALDKANANPSISGIVLQIDSPGGSVDGTQQFANAIKNSAKPVVAYVNGMMASAAMWIGSAASQRIASSNTDVIGSIGTMASWRDFKGYYEEMGIKTHEVYASDSTHKNLQFREANGNNAEGKINYEPLIKSWLDPFNSEFTGAIKENLPNVDNTVLNGSIYIGADAKKKGLIDKIGSFESAVKAALQLGKQKQQIQNSNTMKWSKVLAFFGITTAATAADIKLEDAQVDNLEALITERDTLLASNKTLTENLTATGGQLTKANDDLTAANLSLKAANEKIVALGKTDGTVLTTAGGEDGKEKSATPWLDFQFEKDARAKLT